MWRLVEEGTSDFVAGVTLPPTFWKWETAKSGRRFLIPWGDKPSTYTVLDMYRIIVAPALSGTPLGVDLITLKQEILAASRMIENTALKNIMEGAGGHPRPFKANSDDDYPGATQPMLPSNAALLAVLCLERDACAEFDLTVSDRAPYVAALVQFLKNQQSLDGSWSVYRYADRPTLIAPAAAAFTSLAIRALVRTMRFWPEFTDEIEPALRRAIDFVDANVVDVEVEAGSSEKIPGVRAEFKSYGTYSVQETLDLALARAAAATALGTGSGAGATRAREAARAAVSHWKLGVTPKDNIYLVSFLPPLENAYAPARTTWEQPGHARMLINLMELPRAPFASLGVTAEELQQDARARQNIDGAAAMICAAAKDMGCWYDFNLDDCVFPSNMVYFVDALCLYLEFMESIGEAPTLAS
jgi:hypothetical protein